MRLLRRLYGPVLAEATLPAAPDVVFAVLSDPATYPRWLVGADHIRGVDDRFPHPGSTFEHSVGPGGPLTIDDRSEVLEEEPDRHLALLVHAGPFHARVDFDVRSDGAGGTHICFREQPVGVLSALTPVLRPTLFGRNAASLGKLRDLLETEAPA